MIYRDKHLISKILIYASSIIAMFMVCIGVIKNENIGDHFAISFLFFVFAYAVSRSEEL
jgi:hypothetical protein